MKVTTTLTVYGEKITAPDDLHPTPGAPQHYTYLRIYSNELHPHLCTVNLSLSKGREVSYTVPVADLRRMLDAVSA